MTLDEKLCATLKSVFTKYHESNTITNDEIINAIINYINLYENDYRIASSLMDEERYEEALAILEEKINKDVWLRHVLVPGYTLEEERLKKLANFLRNYRCIKRIDLLPFHKMGNFKWKEAGIIDEFACIREPMAEEVAMAEEIMKFAMEK